MRRLFSSLLLASTLIGASPNKPEPLTKNQIFIGATTGFATYRNNKEPWINSFVWGFKGGYQHNFNPYVSLRGQIEYLMAIKPTAFNTLVSSFVGLHVDMVNDFYHKSKYAFGTYIGLGLGYFQGAHTLVSSTDNRSFMGYNGVLDVGFGSTIDKQHRVELGIKIPFGKINAVNNKFLSMDFYYWLASYAYLF
ncbi:outer membrane beta-barrel protein [Helicobacter suis]|uniref:outer membrane beta-barrel protein n=1 Tax=Helicobacter suis TaxID=104628 RepID=UPI0013D115A7|nr:outer membrane beta-barrel protein [Helicobacter suis]